VNQPSLSGLHSDALGGADTTVTREREVEAGELRYAEIDV
jgi:hypothetical protein